MPITYKIIQRWYSRTWVLCIWLPSGEDWELAGFHSKEAAMAAVEDFHNMIERPL